jgi:hydroxymethylbilane synthase
VSRGIRLGTRASALALAQSESIAARLRELDPRTPVELVHVRTTGDRVQNRPLAEIGGKALFVKEIEEAILCGAVDAGVHSMKDLPGLLPEGLAIVAVPEREDPRDVLVHGGGGLGSLPRGARLGTSSPRRAALALAARPDLRIVPLRGNVETRIAKWRAGEVDALLLAAAGLRRLGIELAEAAVVEPEEMLPAIGQGALAIEARADAPVADRLRRLDDPGASVTTAAERAFLVALGGDCHTPIAGFATGDRERVRLRGVVSSTDGRRVVRGESSGGAGEAAALGTALAEELLGRGARAILEEPRG